MNTFDDIEKHEILMAIRDGVADAIFRVATNATDMPCADFYEAIAEGVARGMPDIDDDGLTRKR